MPISRQRVLRCIALGIFILSLELRRSLLPIHVCRHTLNLPISGLLRCLGTPMSRPLKAQPIKDTYRSLMHVLWFLVRRKVEWSLIRPVSGVVGENFDSNFPFLGNFFPNIMLIVSHLGLNFFLLTIVVPLRKKGRNVGENIFFGYIWRNRVFSWPCMFLSSSCMTIFYRVISFMFKTIVATSLVSLVASLDPPHRCWWWDRWLAARATCEGFPSSRSSLAFRGVDSSLSKLILMSFP